MYFSKLDCKQNEEREKERGFQNPAFYAEWVLTYLIENTNVNKQI